MSEEECESNADLQADEIEALSAIYGEEWIVEDLDRKVYGIEIKANNEYSVYLQVSLPPGYPTESPPIYQLSAPWMKKSLKDTLSNEIEEIYCRNLGQSILYQWIEKIREFVTENVKHLTAEATNSASDIFVDERFDCLSISACLGFETEDCDNSSISIEHGEPVVDRRSTFQAHLAHVTTVEQAKLVVSKLKENRKIASATHNIVAYRIAQGKPGLYYQDCDDDGENKGGSVLLHLLQVLNAQNVVVVVSRWYGGIHLGSDRFKHISNAARDLLNCCGYIENNKTQPKKTKKKEPSKS